MQPEYQFGMSGTKWSIFEASVELFAKQGYQTVSMKDIANEVGVRASSLYNHFKSKDEILATIYEYMHYYAEYKMANLDELLQLAETEHPHVVLKNTHRYFHPDIQNLMGKMIILAMNRMINDNRAEAVVKWMLIDRPKRYISAILQRMLALGRIQALDIDAFCEVHACYNYAASQRMYTSFPAENQLWLEGLEMIIGIVKVTV